MKPSMIIGLVLLILGVLLLGWQGVAFFTTQEPVAQIGPFQLSGPVQHAVWLGPIIGGVVIVVGLIVMVMGAGRRAS